MRKIRNMKSKDRREVKVREEKMEGKRISNE
jgi:hypothetical protein